jgi:hypothetical protein
MPRQVEGAELFAPTIAIDRKQLLAPRVAAIMAPGSNKNRFTFVDLEDRRR